MATYKEAFKARQLIERVATLNNASFQTVTELGTIRATLLALPAAERTAVIQAITDQGFDPTQIQDILTQWNAVKATLTSEGIVLVDRP